MAVIPKVKAIYTCDMESLESYKPTDPRSFSLSVRAMVGPAEGQGQESFDRNVCTPKWLQEQTDREGYVLGLHRLFVASYNPSQIRQLITKFIERCGGNSWSDVANKISRIASWEFEDYRR